MTQSKPIYENKNDYLVEQKLADFLCKKWKCEMYRQKKLSQFDFIAHKDGKPKALIELRKLNCSKDKYPTAMVSMTKLVAWQTMYGVTRLPCLFVVQWQDAVGYVDLQEYVMTGDFRMSPISHNRRNPADDREIVAHLPVENFTFFKGANLNE